MSAGAVEIVQEAVALPVPLGEPGSPAVGFLAGRPGLLAASPEVRLAVVRRLRRRRRLLGMVAGRRR